MNSILSHIINNKVDKFSEVRLAYNSSVRGQRIMLLVEGKDDEKFYERFASDNLFVYSIEGCEYMEKILAKMNRLKNRRIAGIKDADFDVLNNRVPIEPSLFLTDCHDHEMMCSSEESCQIVGRNYGIDTEEGKNIHYLVMEGLKEISLIKWYCSLIRLHYSQFEIAPDNVSFEKCKVANHYNLTLSNNVIRVNLKQKHLYAPLNYGDIERFVNRKTVHDNRLLVNGHDYSWGIAHEIKKLTKRNITIGEIMDLLRDCMTLDKFLQTKVAQDISNYFAPMRVWQN